MSQDKAQAQLLSSSLPFINSCKRHSSIHIYHNLVHQGKHSAAAVHHFLALWPIRGAENAGFINCCAPQIFLHGFVIK
jgi:hypothetical protein